MNYQDELQKYSATRGFFPVYVSHQEDKKWIVVLGFTDPQNRHEATFVEKSDPCDDKEEAKSEVALRMFVRLEDYYEDQRSTRRNVAVSSAKPYSFASSESGYTSGPSATTFEQKESPGGQSSAQEPSVDPPSRNDSPPSRNDSSPGGNPLLGCVTDFIQGLPPGGINIGNIRITDQTMEAVSSFVRSNNIQDIFNLLRTAMTNEEVFFENNIFAPDFLTKIKPLVSCRAVPISFTSAESKIAVILTTPADPHGGISVNPPRISVKSNCGTIVITIPRCESFEHVQVPCIINLLMGLGAMECMFLDGELPPIDRVVLSD